MNGYDPQMAQRVWQRVQSRTTQEDSTQQLQPRIASALTDAALCRLLLPRFQAEQKQLLQHVVREKTAHAHCLQGIFRSITGSAPDVRISLPPPGTTEGTLQRCLGNTLSCIEYYRQWESPAGFSPVFSRLAEEETALARILLQLLGQIQ